MRRTLIFAAPLAIAAAACQAGQPEQDQNLSERASGPEQLANEAGTTAAQANLEDSMPDQPVGPTSDRGSGTGGDSTSN